MFSRGKLISLDDLTAVVAFLDLENAIYLGAEAYYLNIASQFNPAVMTISKKKRYVADMEIEYDDKKKKWIVNGGKPLPLVKPPPTILGFGNISIGFSAGSKLGVLFLRIY